MAEDWTEKYRPETLDGIIGNPSAASEIRRWAQSWDNGVPKKRALVLIGSPGIGKTSSAEALANEMGWGVVEMNASDQRTGKAIKDVALRASNFNTFADDGSFLSTKDGGRKLIILDEADSLYGNADRGAMPVINELIRNTKQPLILICNDFYALSRKSSTVKTGTLQIRFRKPSSASVTKVLRGIIASEGLSVDDSALRLIADNANGDLRAAVRDLESLTQGNPEVTGDDASALWGRAERKSDYDLMSAIFRKRDPALATKTLFETDEDPETVSLWVDENLPYECHDTGDLVRCTGKLARADIYLGRARSTRYFGLWSYANQMMTWGIIDSLKNPRVSHDRIRFPSYLSKMSRSRGSRNTRKALALKIGAYTHASENAIYNDVLPYLAISANGDRELRAFLVRDVGLEAEELGFLLDKKIDSKMVKQAFEDAFPQPEKEEKPKKRKKAKKTDPEPSLAFIAPDPEVPKEKEPETVDEGTGEDVPPAGQKSLFDFRGLEHG